MNRRIRILRKSFFAVVFIGMYSCVSQQKDLSNESLTKSDTFPKRTEVELTADEFPATMYIEGLSLTDSILTLKGRDGNRMVYTYNIYSHELLDSMLVKGQGPNEYTMPEIVILENGRLLVADNTKQKWDLWASDSIIQTGKMPFEMSNRMNDIAFPVVGFIEGSPLELIFKIQDLIKDEVVDSLVIENIEIGGRSKNSLFSWGKIDGENKLVLGFTYINDLMMVDLEDNKIVRTKKLIGKTEDNHRYYSAINSVNNKIYALTQKDKIYKEPNIYEGTSVIEVYDIEGNPLEEIILPISASLMSVDGKSNTVVLLGSADDNIYYFKLD